MLYRKTLGSKDGSQLVVGWRWAREPQHSLSFSTISVEHSHGRGSVTNIELLGRWTITSRGPWGALTLPMASFIQMKQESEEPQLVKNQLLEIQPQRQKTLSPRKSY